MRRHLLLALLASISTASSAVASFPFPQQMHPSFQPHYGCFGYCPGPLNPGNNQPHWGCFGYCPGPITPQQHWGCFGYCPGPLPNPSYPYPTYSYMPVPTNVYAPVYSGDVNYAAPQVQQTKAPDKSDPPPQKPQIPMYQGKTVAQWTELLQSGNARERGNAVAALATFGARASVAAPNLIELLDDPDANVRLQTTLALAIIGKEALPSLRLALQSKNPLMRMGAALTLGHMDAAAAPLVPELRQLLEDPEVSVRCHAAQALWRIDAKADVVLPTFIAALKSSQDHNVQMGVLSTLSQMGDAADPALPALKEVLKNSTEGQVRLAAALAVWNLDNDAALVVPVLETLLDNKSAGYRYDAAHALGEIGKAAQAALPALAKTLRDSDESVVQQAAAAMSQIGARAVPLLIDAIAADNATARRSAVVALGNIGTEAKAAVPVLRAAATSDADPVMRLLARSALGEIDPAAVPKGS